MGNLYALPHTGMRVPNTSISVTHIDQFPLASGGIAWQAEVCVGSTPLGTLHDEGQGGSTIFEPMTDNARRAMDLFVTMCRDPDENPLLDETVYDTLAEEHEVASAVEVAIMKERYMIRCHFESHISKLLSVTLPSENPYPDYESARAGLSDNFAEFGEDLIGIELWTGSAWDTVF
jgi:hypothetical protein